MDTTHINTFLSVAGGLVTALGGWEFVKYLLNRRSNRRIAEANAFKIEREAIIEDYKRVQQEVDELKKKVDELYSRLHELEGERLDLIRRNNELELELKEAEKRVCLQPDDKCLRRLNDNVKCRLVGLLRGSYTKDHPDAIMTEEDMMNPEGVEEAGS